MSKVFISGKIKGVPEYNAPAFKSAEEQLTAQGHAVFNPVKLHPADPTMFDAEDYLHCCFSMIDRCDTVYFLSSWSESPGARLELDYAIEHGKNLEFEVRG
jgi:hypothetical protein